MEYCPPGVSFFDIWRNHGTSECFMDTITSSILFGYLFLFGSFELWMYWRNGCRVAAHSLRRPFLYILQLFLTVLLAVFPIVKFLIEIYVFKDVVYGYSILSVVFTVLVYPISFILIIVERNFLLPSLPTRGHGLILLVFWTLMFVFENFTFFNLERKDWWFALKTFNDKLQMALFVIKYTSCLLLFGIGLKAPGIKSTRDYLTMYDDSTAQLTYEEEQGASTATSSTWKSAWKRFKTLIPFLWPKKDFWLQVSVVICVLLLIGGRVVNLFVPIYNKMIVDSMDRAYTKNISFRWDLVLVYVGLKFLQGGGTGGMGLLNNLRSFLWVKVQQYTTREVEVELFRHLHGLSLRWHLSRKTGEVLRVMDRGTDSINNLLSYILFNIFPTITDILVAVTFFVVKFNVWFGLIVFLTLALYIAATIGVTEWRTKFQRKMNLADNATKARSVDSLLNFETVKYYGAEDYEVDAYREAINNFQVEEWKSIVSLNLLNTLQNITVCAGLLAGSLLCVYDVVYNQTLKVGDYVLFASYILQLYVPLNWFGTYYRAIQKNFIDMENMFDLLAEKPEVVDIPSAQPLQITDGSVKFKNVSFSYTPERIVLKNVSFEVPPGKTVALVGPSGAGKSTIIRLLFRFYDITEGSIMIDGIDIKHVTQKSLRKAIGVVPQDTVLFNNTIKYNIQYGRVYATEDEVIRAAANADIHDKILTFPEGYETQVGERGLKLSGGEKQRVAIARTILKSPAVVLLDEATSALDTQTERNIQSALARVCANRTTIIVAHRLSTIIHSDEILVLKDGEIVERGTHDELLALNQQYGAMWAQQLANNSSEKTTEDPPGEGASTSAPENH